MLFLAVAFLHYSSGRENQPALPDRGVGDFDLYFTSMRPGPIFEASR
jgi:hypothetical protein